jgi:hypothetical protein
MITPDNIKFLTIDDLKGIGIPIGPCRQIVNDFKQVNRDEAEKKIVKVNLKTSD